jgi:hypothetical protein
LPNVSDTLYDRLWTIAEAYSAFADLVRVGNRLKLSGDGWMRKFFHGAPIDYPQLEIALGRYSHSGYTQTPTLGNELDGHCGVDITRVEQVNMTITVMATKTTTSHPLKESLIDAFMAAGPRLGIPNTVAGWGPISGEQRDARADEKPAGGMIITVNFPVTLYVNNYKP